MRAVATGALAAGALALALLATAAPVRAQEAAPPAPQAAQGGGPASGEAAPSKPQPPQPIPLPEVAARADQVNQELRQIDARITADPRVEEIEGELDQRRGSLERYAEDTRKTIDAGASLRSLNDLQPMWESAKGRLSGWQDVLSARTGAVGDDVKRLDALVATWSATLAEAKAQGVPPAVRQSIASTLESLRETRGRAQKRANALLAVQNRVSDASRLAEDVLAQIVEAKSAQQGRIFEPDRPPLWSAVRLSATGEGLGRVRDSLARDASRLVRFLDREQQPLLLHLLVLVAAVAGAYALRRRSRRRQAEARSLGPSEAIFENPISIAILATLPLALAIYPTPPRVVLRVVGVLVWIPVLLVLRKLVSPGLRAVLPVLAGFYLADRVRGVFEAAPLIERGLFLIEMGVALVLVLWALRPERLRNVAPDTRIPRVFSAVMRAAAVGFAVALVSEVLGLTNLGHLLGEGLLGAAYTGVLLFAVARVLQLVAAAVLAIGSVRRTRLVQHSGPALLRRFDRLVGFAATISWLWALTEFFTVNDALMRGLRAVFGTELAFGSVSFDLGGVALFVLTVWISLWISRALRAVLEDEVFPRARLARGVPGAISALAQYTVLLLGFLLAVGAAGIDFSKVTLLAGALGVGIGFGLQNVVNNFVSGLILLFERPIQVGDTVQTGDLFGEVKRIGIRSSTVRTWEGAEVIVPNAHLISEQVINWTLSDRNRRVDVKVGVAYGTDPGRVLELLVAAARTHPEVLAEPEPVALFTGFGDSSLDFELRAWTGRADRFVRIRSELAVAVHAAIRDAGITIPFPQRDLHVMSVEEQAASRLRGQ